MRQDERLWLVAFLAAAPLSEELVFRAALYRGLRALAGPGAATLGSAACFTLLHDASNALPIFLLACLLARAYERTAAIIVPITMHAVQNALALALATWGSGGG